MENLEFSGNIIYVNHSKYKSDNWHSIMHSHSFSEILYVVSGSGQFVIQDKKIDIKEDDLIIVNPNIEHTEKSKENFPLEYIVIGIDGIKFESNMDGLDFVIHNYAEYKHNVLFYIKALLIEYISKDQFYDRLSKKLAEILLINIIRYNTENFNITSAQKSSSAKKECILIENYINQHFKEQITLDTLCSLTHLNKFYVAHIFKEYKNQSIMTYLNERRIKEAKMLLETSNLNIGTISSIIGFNSQSYFTQAFKLATGLSPASYRKKHYNN